MVEKNSAEGEVFPKRGLKDYAKLTLKGIGMGAADVVPGVSGGTIALITNIYQELIDTMRSFDLQAVKLLYTGRFSQLWKKINGSFLVALLLGIFISFLSVAKLVTMLLDNHPILVWAFFFGLVLASTLFVTKGIKKWNVWRVLEFIAGAVVAYLITEITPTETSDSLFFIFLCGAIAICAMILPGISGSFILVLLGKYKYMMEALLGFNIPVILVFVLGAAMGITSFSHLLSYLLRRFEDITIAVLSGFMLGSLNKVWPWKEQVTEVVERNVLPNEYVWEGILLMVVGFVIVLVIEKLSGHKSA